MSKVNFPTSPHAAKTGLGALEGGAALLCPPLLYVPGFKGLLTVEERGEPQPEVGLLPAWTGEAAHQCWRGCCW